MGEASAPRRDLGVLAAEGYAERRNLALEVRWTKGKPERILTLATGMVGL